MTKCKENSFHKYFELTEIEVGYLGNSDSYARGISQTYSLLVQAYCLKKTSRLSDQPFSSYTK